jgi:DNA-binding response OmpR family regulator
MDSQHFLSRSTEFMKILIVEDEQHIADGLRFNLEAEGYEAEIANDGETALDVLSNSKFDAIVLDVMLPGVDGFQVARTIRDRKDYTPILMLTARGRPEDVLRGFEAGTDDYLPKPFDLNIFIARLNGLLRRQQWTKERPTPEIGGTFQINGKTIDFDNLELISDEGVTRLTLMEMKLLRFLIENEGQTVSRKTILEDVWNLQEDTDTRAIDNFIVRLRKYLEDEPNNPKFVRTVRGVGYKFVRSDE